MRHIRALTASVLAATAIGAFASQAQAAPACASFQGFYIGGNAGYASYNTTWTDRDNWADRFNTDIGLGSVDKHDSGFTAGAQGGFNSQMGCSLIGGEVDWNWANVDASNAYTANGDPAQYELDQRDEIKWFGTLRLRGGVVVDNLLLFATAGAAFADIKHSWAITDNSPTFEAFSTSNTRWGFAGGGGAEWALAEGFSVKGEVLYLDFGDDTTTRFSNHVGGDFSWDNLDTVLVGRVGFNWHFGT